MKNPPLPMLHLPLLPVRQPVFSLRLPKSSRSFLFVLIKLAIAQPIISVCLTPYSCPRILGNGDSGSLRDPSRQTQPHRAHGGSIVDPLRFDTVGDTSRQTQPHRAQENSNALFGWKWFLEKYLLSALRERRHKRLLATPMKWFIGVSYPNCLFVPCLFLVIK